jgi:plastocyanin
MKKILLGLMVIGVLLLVVSCSTNVPEEPINLPQQEVSGSVLVSGEVHPIVVESGQFMPRDLEVEVGDTVEWTNKESTEHTVSLENGNLDEQLPSEGRASYTFMEQGEFRYFCKFHPEMQGTVSVS